MIWPFYRVHLPKMFNFLDGKDLTFTSKFQAMKKHLAIFAVLLSVSLFSQGTPAVELGAGLALKHTEGFYVPRYTVSGVNLFRSFGLYATYEQRNDVTFYDDFNGDGNYQRYTIGPVLSMNKNLYAFGGISPFGPYGLTGEGGFGKVRKEVGLGLIFNPVTLRIGYSNWVGTTIGAHYRFGFKAGAIKLPKPEPLLASTDKQVITQEVETIVKVDTTVVVIYDTIKTIQEEVNITNPIQEIEKLESGTLLCTIYFEFNSEVPNEASKDCLKQIADALENYPQLKLDIVGHTDPVGSSETNYRLGLKRAAQVKSFIEATFGTSASQLITSSKGEDELISTDNAINRRVEVRTR